MWLSVKNFSNNNGRSGLTRLDINAYKRIDALLSDGYSNVPPDISIDLFVSGYV